MEQTLIVTIKAFNVATVSLTLRHDLVIMMVEVRSGGECGRLSDPVDPFHGFYSLTEPCSTFDMQCFRKHLWTKSVRRANLRNGVVMSFCSRLK